MMQRINSNLNVNDKSCCWSLIHDFPFNSAGLNGMISRIILGSHFLPYSSLSFIFLRRSSKHLNQILSLAARSSYSLRILNVHDVEATCSIAWVVQLYCFWPSIFEKLIVLLRYKKGFNSAVLWMAYSIILSRIFCQQYLFTNLFNVYRRFVISMDEESSKSDKCCLFDYFMTLY